MDRARQVDAEVGEKLCSVKYCLNSVKVSSVLETVLESFTFLQYNF